MSLYPGQIVNNRYRIVKLLGQGGFGAVYRAWDLNLSGPCALKENFDTSPEAQSQFAREASMLYNLRYPNLPKVTDYFSVPGQGQYLVMEYIEGEDLQEMLDHAGGPLAEAQVLAWMVQVFDALIYLHGQNPPVVHRDLKPANVRITPQGVAMLVDFGIAKIYDPERKTTIGARAATPGYAPIEQYGQEPTDTRTDIYALGATLYAALTGKEPLESIARGSGKVLVSPRQLNPEISAQSEAAIVKAMALMPDQRFPSVAEFKAAMFPKLKVAAPVTGNSVVRVSEIAASDAAVVEERDLDRRTGSQGVLQTGKRSPIWKFLLVLALVGLFFLVAAGVFALAVVPRWAATGQETRAAAAVAVATGVQATRLAEESATLQAKRNPLSLTQTALSQGGEMIAEATNQVQNGTSEASASTPGGNETQAAIQVTATGEQTPAGSQPASPPIMLTDWVKGHFVELSSGCNVPDVPVSPCWKGDWTANEYKVTGSFDIFIRSKSEVFIDPKWASPYLVFWHQYRFLEPAYVSVKSGSTWNYLEIYNAGSSGDEWAMKFYDLSEFKGLNVLFQFSTSETKIITGKDVVWYLQGIQIIPDFTPPK
jgi:hypothetical protein